MHRVHEETGAGLVSSIAGVLAFLAFLLLAVQILVHLFATSYVTAAAFDAARLASGAGGADAAAARDHGLGVLGDFAERVSEFDVVLTEERVVVRVRATSPALLPAVFGRVIGTESIDRTVTLRRERLLCAGC